MSRKSNKTQKSVKSNVNNSKIMKNESSSNQSVDNQMTNQTEEQRLIRRAYELSPEWRISQIAKKRFLNLPTEFQSSKGKEVCIKETLKSHRDLIPDSTRYWIWLIDETEKLTRVWDFEDVCKEAELDPMIVAQHLILEGKMVCNAIRMEGLRAYGSKVRMFVDPLFADEFSFFGKKSKEVA